MEFKDFKSTVEAHYPKHSFLFVDNTHKWDHALGPITSQRSGCYTAYSESITVQYLGNLLRPWRVNKEMVDW